MFFCRSCELVLASHCHPVFNPWTRDDDIHAQEKPCRAPFFGVDCKKVEVEMGVGFLHLKEFEQALEAITSAAQEVYGSRLVSLAVFGSVGRGTPRPDSDIDLLVVADKLPKGRLKRMEEFSLVEEIVQYRTAGFKHIKMLDLSPVIKEREEVLRGSFLFLDLVEDARICYDRENFLTQYLSGLKEKLKKMGARRIYRGGTWYWVLKQDYTPGEEIEI